LGLWLQQLGLCSALTTPGPGGILIVPHLLLQLAKASVFTILSKGLLRFITFTTSKGELWTFLTTFRDPSACYFLFWVILSSVGFLFGDLLVFSLSFLDIHQYLPIQAIGVKKITKHEIPSIKYTFIDNKHVKVTLSQLSLIAQNNKR
jgi:hypothetical protein